MSLDHRSFKKLRISLTDQCNYSCIYCTTNSKPESSILSVQSKIKPLSTNELLSLASKLHNELALTAVRLTGGEPMLYPHIERVVEALKEMGIHNIGITTNGHTLFTKIKALKDAGLTSVNISIDALNSETFGLMSQTSGLPFVLRSITSTLEHNIKLKLNTVVVAGKNDDQIIPLLEFAMEHGVIIRFLELMPMGPLHQNRKELFFSQADILKRIQTKYQVTQHPHELHATANYWSVNGKMAFGIIANDSTPFCADCNRLRLDSYGNIYGCLSSLIPISIYNKNNSELKVSLKKALSDKQPAHFVGNERTMQSIGG